MGIKIKFSGKNLVHDLKKEAREFFKGSHASCVSYAIPCNKVEFQDASTRLKDGKEFFILQCPSGTEGTTLLNSEVGSSYKNDPKYSKCTNIREAIEIFMNNEIAKYTVKQCEPWSLDNCAEAHMAFYLHIMGMAKSYYIVSFGRDGNYKAPCKNCNQWLKSDFCLLPDYQKKLNL